MIKHKDITGKKFGKLTALQRLHNNKGLAKWLCVCECGNLVEVNCYNLNNGHTKSCGCLQKCKASMLNKTHGLTDTRLFHIWSNMKQRCYNKNAKKYPNYGHRGITVCDEWRNDFMNFYDWAINSGYSDNLTIDRIDVNGNYEPNNCRWATLQQQARNRRNTPMYTLNGVTRCLSEWCEIYNIKYHTVYNRIKKYNHSIKKALELEAME